MPKSGLGHRRCSYKNRCSENIFVEPRKSAALHTFAHCSCMDMHRITVVYTYICAAVGSAHHAIKQSNFIIGLDGSPLPCEQGVAARRIFVETFQASADDAKLICKSASRLVPILEQL